MERAFFPGGNGLFHGSNGNVPVKGILVLGSNFGCVTDYVQQDGSHVRRDETGSSNTWKGLYRLLAPKTEIELHECFFTNAWPFLHEGDSNETKGLITHWLTDRALMGMCLNLFRATVALIQPRMVIALGTGTSTFLGHVWPEFLRTWQGNSIAAMDQSPFVAVHHDGVQTVCVAITHPSHSNSWQRRPPYKGTEGEIELLREAWALARLNR
jgi:hypothetical protein